MSNITTSTNEYDIKMLEIQTESPRNVFISLSKAQAILATNLDADLINPVHFKGRDLFEITKSEGGKFKVGENKLNAVLDNADAIGSL